MLAYEIQIANRSEQRHGTARTVIADTTGRARAELTEVLGSSPRGRGAIRQLLSGAREQVTVGSLTVCCAIVA